MRTEASKVSNSQTSMETHHGLAILLGVITAVLFINGIHQGVLPTFGFTVLVAAGLNYYQFRKLVAEEEEHFRRTH